MELHLLVSALLPGLGRFAVGTDPVSNFPSLSTGPGSSGVPVPPPSHLRLLTPVHSHLQPLMPGNSHPQPHTPEHSLPGRWGRGGAFVTLRTPGWNILILHFLKVFDLIAVFKKINVKFSYLNHNFMILDSVFVRFL